jgi:hypothetical protein
MKRPTTIDEMDPTTDASVSSDLRSCLILRQLLREILRGQKRHRPSPMDLNAHASEGLDNLVGTINGFGGQRERSPSLFESIRQESNVVA